MESNGVEKEKERNGEEMECEVEEDSEYTLESKTIYWTMQSKHK